MPRPPLLSEEDITQKLAELPGWERSGACIRRTLTASNFAAAVGVINAIAILAEKADHHPDLRLHGWNKLEITLATHDQGGLTKLDFELAAEIDSIGFGASATA